MVQTRSYFGIIGLYDDVDVEDRDDTPIMRETDDDCLIQSDNIDTQRLYLQVNPRVVSAVCPDVRTFSRL